MEEKGEASDRSKKSKRTLPSISFNRDELAANFRKCSRCCRRGSEGEDKKKNREEGGEVVSVMTKSEQHPPHHAKLELKATLKDYCEHSTIHGIRYVMQEGRPTGERVFWTVVLLMGILGSGYLVLRAYHDWRDNLIVVSQGVKLMQASEVPFPAVTVCSAVTVDEKKYPFDRQRERLWNATFHQARNWELRQGTPEYEEFEKMLAFTSFCYKDVRDILETFLGSGSYIWAGVWDNATSPPIRVIEKLAPIESWDRIVQSPTCGDLVVSMGPNKLPPLPTTLTKHGYCATFNNLQLNNRNLTENWDPELGYLSPYREESCFRDLPLRIGRGELGQEFTFTLATPEGSDFCRAPDTGVSVLIHSPMELPHNNYDYFAVDKGQELEIKLRPRVIKTSADLRSFPVEQRQCLFQGEVRLAYFKYYSRTNCLLECEANETLAYDKCLLYYMPRPNHSTPFCSPARIEKPFRRGEPLPPKPPRPEVCKCLPSCDTVTYKAEGAYTNSDVSSSINRVWSNDTLIVSKTLWPGVKIRVRFAEDEFTYWERKEQYTIVDFIANSGGLVSLFTGLSALSLCEVIYYFLIVRRPLPRPSYQGGGNGGRRYSQGVRRLSVQMSRLSPRDI